MKLRIIYLLALCFWAGWVTAQVYPSPQEVTPKNQTVNLPAAYRLIGSQTANPYAVQKLSTLLKGQTEDASAFPVYIGERGDKAIRKYVRMIPKHAEGYYLLVAPDRIVVAGNDERGTYYAVQSLRQLLQEDTLKAVEIKDYPTVASRGVVEGFYGTPWSHAARLRQLQFYGENKMNTYIYGPKDDPYHSCPNWRKPYPEKEAAQIKELVQVAKDNAVDFVWAIHPGQDIRWNEEDRNLLLEKFEKMYQLGVRAFAVFFDDISGEGTDPVRQAELLNYIHEYFVKVKGDVNPLIVCPTEYNKSWSNPAKGYLTTFGSKLNPSIRIMWTGDRVIADITKEGLDWINEKIKRPAYIWWNFPVSDYVRDHLVMGPVYGNDLHIGHQMSGFVSNPMERAEASKIAIFSVADYAWNPEKYNSDESWKQAIRVILPQDADALQVFASHNSDLGPSGHGYRRDESVTIQPVVSRFLRNYRQGTYTKEDFTALMDEFSHIVEAADILSVNQENKALIEEIQPWCYQFRNMGISGVEVLLMAQLADAGKPQMFMRKYNHMKALQQIMYQVDQTYNQNPYQPGVKTGSKIMQPFIDSLFVLAVQRYNQKQGTALSSEIFTSPHRSVSTVAQFKTLPVRVRNNLVIVSPMLEVVKWGAGQSLSVELDQIYPLKNVDADFGMKNTGEWLQMEISTDGTTWNAVPVIQNGNQLKAALNSAQAKYIRVINKTGKEQEAYLRKFIISL